MNPCSGKKDLIAILLFLLISFAAVSGFYQVGKVYLIDGDAVDIAGISLASKNPHLFPQDYFLGDQRNFEIYRTFFFPVLKLANSFVDDLGKAFTLLKGPFFLLHLGGFYFLGVLLYRSRFWAFLLALVSLSYIDVFVGEYYGTIFTTPLPRDLFFVLLPFLLAFAWYVKEKPRLWPVLLLVAGFFVFIHGASGPQVGFGIWLALWVVHPKHWSREKRCSVMLGLGMVFLLGATPGLLGLGGTPPGEVDYHQSYKILQT